MHKNYMKTEKPSKTYIDGSKPAAAKLALTFTLSALEATATLSLLFLYCYTNNTSIQSKTHDSNNNVINHTYITNSRAPRNPISELGFAYCK